jgi:hypothetical protein
MDMTLVEGAAGATKGWLHAANAVLAGVKIVYRQISFAPAGRSR